MSSGPGLSPLKTRRPGSSESSTGRPSSWSIAKPARQAQHARTVGADPDADRVRRLRAGRRLVEAVVASLEGDRFLAPPPEANQADRLLQRLDGLAPAALGDAHR